MTEVPEGGRSEARLYKVTLQIKAAKEAKTIRRITQILEGMEDFGNDNPESFPSSLEHFLGPQVDKYMGKETKTRSMKRQAELVNEEYQTDLEPRRARSEAVHIKPAEGMSYATILRDLKKRVNPDELGTTVQGIRETRPKDLLVELRCPKEGRARLDSAFKEQFELVGLSTISFPALRLRLKT